MRASLDFSVQPVVTSWTFRDLNAGGGEIIGTQPDRPWEPPNLLLEYREFSGGNCSQGLLLPPTSSRAEIKERVKI